MKVNVLRDIIVYYVRVNQDKEVNMALIRTVLVSTPDNRRPDDIGARRYTDKPFMLQIGGYQHILSYAELSKLMADADGEIRDYLGEEHG